MSWSRFTLVALVTMVVMLPLSPLVAALVAPFDEPLRTVVVIGLSVAVYVALNQLLTLILARVRRPRPRP